MSAFPACSMAQQQHPIPDCPGWGHSIFSTPAGVHFSLLSFSPENKRCCTFFSEETPVQHQHFKIAFHKSIPQSTAEFFFCQMFVLSKWLRRNKGFQGHSLDSNFVYLNVEIFRKGPLLSVMSHATLSEEQTVILLKKT